MIADADKCLYFDYIYRQSLSLLYSTNCVDVNEDLEEKLFNHLIVNDLINDCPALDNNKYYCLNYYNITEVNKIYNSCLRPVIKCPAGNNSVIFTCDIEVTELTDGINCNVINLNQI